MAAPPTWLPPMVRQFLRAVQEGGRTESQAIAELARDYPFAPPEDRALAAYYANLSAAVGERIPELGFNRPIREALRGNEAPTEQVTLRANIVWHDEDGNFVRANDRLFTVSWNTTHRELSRMIEEWAEQANTSGEPGPYTYEIRGPTLWDRTPQTS